MLISLVSRLPHTVGMIIAIIIIIIIIIIATLVVESMYAKMWEEDRLTKCTREEIETQMQIERNREALKVCHHTTDQRPAMHYTAYNYCMS